MAKVKKEKRTSQFPYWLVGLVILAAMLVGVFSLIGSPDPTQTAVAPEISVDEAAQRYEDGAFILDVREPYEWEEGHIPNATLIPLGELESRLNELPQDKEIVVVCRSGNRSAAGRDILQESGFMQVTSMAGGMNEWARKGYPVE